MNQNTGAYLEQWFSNMAPELAASASTGNFLEMQTWGNDPRTSESVCVLLSQASR